MASVSASAGVINVSSASRIMESSSTVVGLCNLRATGVRKARAECPSTPPPRSLCPPSAPSPSLLPAIGPIAQVRLMASMLDNMARVECASPPKCPRLSLPSSPERTVSVDIRSPSLPSQSVSTPPTTSSSGGDDEEDVAKQHPHPVSTSPTPSSSGDDEEDVAKQHPYPLPKAPKKHPHTRRHNYYNPKAAWDYSEPCDVIQLHDVRGTAPHRCFLVEWDCSRLQLSWAWEECFSDKFARRIAQVEEWRQEGRPGTFATFFQDNYANRDTASASGGCFMDALRAAMTYLNQPKLASEATKIWDTFESTNPQVGDGVRREDVTDFFTALQKNNYPLHYDQLVARPLKKKRSITSAAAFQKFVMEEVDQGVYIASVGQKLVGHCFVLVANGPNAAPAFLDDSTVPPTPYPLSWLRYIDKVKWFARVALNPGYRCRHGKRKTKKEKKAEKKQKMMAPRDALQQQEPQQ